MVAAHLHLRAPGRQDVTVRPMRLDPAVADAIVEEALLLRRHPEHRSAPAHCRWCSHGYHGLQCAEVKSCGCESSHIARDDSWRPAVSGSFDCRAHRLMDKTGLDGYVACRLLAVAPFWVRRQRLLTLIETAPPGARECADHHRCAPLAGHHGLPTRHPAGHTATTPTRSTS